MNGEATRGMKLGARVAVCQTLCLDGDLEGNLHRIETALGLASEAGADIACFPETAFLGWVNPDAHRRAHPIPGAWSAHIVDAAAQHDIMMAVGLAEKDGDRLYDSAILVDRDGELLLKHRKINTLTHLLDPPYARGSENDISVAMTTFGKIGLLICADTFVEGLLSRMAALEPDLLLVPYGWAAESHKWPQHGEKLTEVVSHAAVTVGCPVVGTDCVGLISHGPWTGHTFGGQSVVTDAKGELLAIAKDREPDIILVDL